MPATTYAAWSTPTDNVHSVTTEDQQETEEAIHKLFAPLRRAELNHVSPFPLHAQDDDDEGLKETNGDGNGAPLANPWLAPAPTSASVSASANAEQPHRIPTLNRQAHLNFLVKQLDPLPAPFVSFDTNRAWLLYWILHSYDLLSATLDPRGRARAITTLLSFQNRATGGFGGGPNQLAHLMSTFAAVLALATVGGPGPAPTPEDVGAGKSIEVGRGGWDEIDRPAMYTWMMSLKQPDGSFLVHENGEVDVRASYCVVCVSMLLGICTPQLVRGLGEFVASCQTYEGGLAAGSQPRYSYQPVSFGGDGTAAQTSYVPYLASLLPTDRPQLGEAHGGYTYCALATHLALSRLPFCGEGPILPTSSANASARSTASSSGRTHSAAELDVPRLLRWATSLQGTPIEGGGFRGRSNKLVDGCYGWFCGGGLFSVLTPVVEEYERQQRNEPHPEIADLNGLSSFPASLSTSLASDTDPSRSPSETTASSSSSSWTTDASQPGTELDFDPTTLYDRIALQEYVLVAAQAPKGGLRDKPGKRPDAYHTNYNLSGLSLSQHRVRPSVETRKALESVWKQDAGGTETGKTSEDGTRLEPDEWKKQCYLSGLAWTMRKEETVVVGRDEEERQTNLVNPTHPIFTITFPKAKAVMDWAYGQL